MLKFERPDKNAANGFDADSAAKLQLVQNQINANEKPKFVDSFWGKYKSHFMKAQNRKCGYCEMKVTDYGDMEHYHPKSTVHKLESVGQERENLHNLEKGSRTFSNLCERGYWWLAYDWDNYLLSCKLCNQAYKKAFFPIKEARSPNPNGIDTFPCANPEEDDNETPLIMNPFDTDLNPGDHIKFTKSGQIIPRNDSEFGKATIEICGLDRDSLNEARQWAVGMIYKFYKNFADSEDGSEQERNSVNNILDMGAEISPAFPGMCRIIFEHLTDGEYTWDYIENY